MDGTIIGQGTFTAFAPSANPNPGNASNSVANAITIAIPSGADWMRVYNYYYAGHNGINTIYFNGTANATSGVEYYWQRGFANGTGVVKYKANGSAAISEDVFTTGGFSLYDPSGQDPNAILALGNPVATTATTNATQPVVSTGSTAGLVVGSVVRMSNTAQTDVNGVDMVVGAVTANVSFTLLTATNVLANVPGAIGGAGFYRIVNYNALFYPRRRVITNITQAANAQVSTAIPHGLTPGQEVRFVIPTVSGMVQLNPFGSITFNPAIILTVVDDYNFTINVNTTNYTAFTYPTIVQQPSSFPIVIPFGEDTATALASTGNLVPSIGGMQIFNTNTGILADSTVNTGYLGMILGSGGTPTTLGTPIAGPSGTVHFTAGNVNDRSDTMYWVAGKSTYGGL
jgi:hypothetical protein